MLFYLTWKRIVFGSQKRGLSVSRTEGAEDAEATGDGLYLIDMYSRSLLEY